MYQSKKDKNKAHNKYCNNLGNINLWITYKKYRAIFRNTIKNAARNSWIQFLNKLDCRTSSTQVWKQVNILRKGPTIKCIILKQNNNTISSPEQVTNILARTFSQKSNGIYTDKNFMKHKHQSESTPISFNSDNTEWYNRPLTMKELHLAITYSKSKSPGPDNIPYEFLKHLNQNNLKHF